MPAVTILALFESITGEVFADTPGIKLASRIPGMGKFLGNLSRDRVLDPPLVQFPRWNRALWNRRPCRPLDVDAWRAGVQEAERLAGPVARLGDQRVLTNAGPVDWVRQHRFLKPV